MSDPEDLIVSETETVYDTGDSAKRSELAKANGLGAKRKGVTKAAKPSRTRAS